MLNIVLDFLKTTKPNISIVMMGGGVKRIKYEFFKRVKENNLESNINYI